jgi:chromosome segregation ATPase
MARFTITLPEKVASKLATDEGKLKTPRSTLIAQYLEQHYTQKPAAEYETALRKSQEDKEQARECRERAEKLTGELREIGRQLETAMEELRKAATKASSQDTVITGLQNELESVKAQTKNLDEKLVIYSGIINDLKADKETLQKQLELVTLRLPAPRVGFWSRVFGSGKKKEEDKK